MMIDKKIGQFKTCKKNSKVFELWKGTRGQQQDNKTVKKGSFPINLGHFNLITPTSPINFKLPFFFSLL